MIRNFLFVLLIFGQTVWAAENINPKDFPAASALTGSEKIPAYQGGWTVATPIDVAVYVDSLDKYSITVATVADLRALPAGKYSTVYVRGYAAPGDGGDGIFVWSGGDYSAEVNLDPYHGIYAPVNENSDGSEGCYLRNYTGDILSSFFGVGDAGIRRAAAWGMGSKITIIAPPGDVEVTEPIQIYPGQTLRGHGIYSTRLYVSTTSTIECIISVVKPDGSINGWPITIENLTINSATGGNSIVDGISSAQIGADLPDGSTAWTYRTNGLFINNVWLSGLHKNLNLSGGDIHVVSVISEVAIGYGAYLLNCNGVSFSDCTFYYSSVNVRIEDDANDDTYSYISGVSNGTQFSNCSFHLGTQRDLQLINTIGRNVFINDDFGHYSGNYNYYSIELSNSSYNKFTGCNIKGARTGVLLSNGSRRNRFVGVDFEKLAVSLSTPAISITGTDSIDNSFVACNIKDCGGNGVESASGFQWIGGSIIDIGLGQTSGNWYAFSSTSGYGALISGVSIRRISSTYMNGILSSVDGPFKIVDCIFSAIASPFTSTASTRHAYNLNTSGNTYSSGGVLHSSLVLGTNVIFYTTSIPSGSTIIYTQGDKAINLSAASGQPPGWIYDGSAWLAEGTL